MMKTARIIIFTILLAALLWPSAALAQDINGDKVVFGGTYTLREGESLNGNLVVVFGVATIEPGALVNGDVVLVGGTVEVGGEVDGTLVGVAGLIELTENAHVSQDLVSVGAELNRASGARVDGDLIENLDAPLSLSIPGGVEMPRISFTFDPIVNFVSFWFRVFMWAAVAVLLVLFAPRYVERTSKTILEAPVISGGIGLLTIVVAPFVLVIMAITLVLIPVSIIAGVALALLWGLGLIAMGVLLGQRIEEALKQDWAPVLTAGIGTFVLIAIVDALKALVPCVGWVFPTLAGMVGLGAVLLSRIGTQPYPPLAPALPLVSPNPPAPPAAPAPTVQADHGLPPGLMDDLEAEPDEDVDDDPLAQAPTEDAAQDE